MKKESAAKRYTRHHDAFTSPTVVLPPTRDWRPLKVAPHPEQGRMIAWRAIPSLKG